MTPTVTLGPADWCLRLTAQPWPTEGHQDPVLEEAPEQRFLKAELHADQLIATVVVDLPRDLGTLPGFFDDLADHWHGWEYARVWQAPFKNLTLNAQRVRVAGPAHDRVPDYVVFEVTLNNGTGWSRPIWTVSTTISIQPADRLSAIARDVHALAGPFD